MRVDYIFYGLAAVVLLFIVFVFIRIRKSPSTGPVRGDLTQDVTAHRSDRTPGGGMGGGGMSE